MGAAAKFYLLSAFVLAIVVACIKPLGTYIAHVMEGRAGVAVRIGGSFERWLYRICGVDCKIDMRWSHYAIALLSFNLLGGVIIYSLQRLQWWLPLNPQKMTAVTADSAFNTAISFITNTNWQGYSGESTMSYLVQMAGLAVQNFLSAATGMAVAIAIIRGFVRHSAQSIGNFWVDVTRATLYVLLPLSAVLAIALVSQGVIQNFDGYKDVTTIEKTTYDNPKTDGAGNPLKDQAGNAVTESVTTQTQTLPMGPVASQEAIKELGTNGGGFFNANSSHPFENPTLQSNLLEIIAILLIPFALTYTFGKMVGDTRQGWALMACMLVLLSVMTVIAYHAEQHGNPLIAKQGIDQMASATQAGGNVEGKETRFGIAASALFAAVTFWPIVAALAIAGSLAAKKRIPITEGTMPTDGLLFITLLIGTILLIGVLNYVPALALGPVVEDFMLAAAH
jgi:potassium-transporting ATPase potassium-binding subunit